MTFKQQSSEERIFLEAPFFIGKIKEVVWHGDSDKTPGAGGFNIGFFKTYWEFLRDDLLRFVDEFYFNPKVRKIMSTSFLPLISKTDNPQCIVEFKPICLYRIIVKLLPSFPSVNLHS